jgi:hypothetical protein
MATVFIPKSTTDLNTSPATTVANGDTVIFGEGSQTIAANLTQWNALAGLAGVFIDPKFTGTIGGASGALEVDVDTTTASLVSYAAGGGALYIKAAGPSSLIERIKHIGSGTLSVTGGTVNRLEQRSGNLSVNSSTTVPAFYMSGGSASFQHITANSAFQKLYISSGSLNTERGLDGNFAGARMTIAGGSVTVARVDSSSTVPTGTDGASGAVIEVFSGGSLTWRGGNIDNLWVIGGAVDLSGITQNVTITNLYIDAAGLSRSTLASKFFAATVTNRFLYACDSDILTVP